MADDTYKTGAGDARIKILRDEFYRQAGHGVAGLSDNECRKLTEELVVNIMLNEVSLRKAIDCEDWEDAKACKLKSDLLRDVIQGGLMKPLHLEVDLAAMRAVVNKTEADAADADGKEGADHE